MIHGTGHIVFKIGSTEYELEETTITKDEIIPKELILESDLANEVYFDNKDERHEINCLYNIYKNESFITQFKTIYALRNSDVKLKFRAGNYFLDTSGSEADYRMTMSLTHYQTGARHDYLLITFRSLKPIDFIESALPENVLVDSNKQIITDSDGNYLTTDD